MKDNEFNCSNIYCPARTHIYCLMNPNSLSFFTSLFAVLVASIIMLFYLMIRWVRLTKFYRWTITLSIVTCLILFYGLVHYNGLTIAAIFLP